MIRKILSLFLCHAARLVLRRYRPKIIALTGSAGKSTTKELLATLLAPHTSLFKSGGSLNNEIGVPLTILLIDWRPGRNPWAWLKVFFRAIKLICLPVTYPSLLILETGVEMPGDMDQLLSIFRPDMAIFTALGPQPAHAQFFTNATAVRDEKAKLIAALPQTGTAILNHDDPLIWAVRHLTPARVLSFGRTPEAQARVINTAPDLQNGLQIELAVLNKPHQLFLPHAINPTLASNLAAAFLAGQTLGYSIEQLKPALANYHDLPGRFRLHRLGDLVLIDDAYNASPISYEKLFEAVAGLPGRKIGVLGDVLEADNQAQQIHETIGRRAGQIFDTCLLVGPRLRRFAAPLLPSEKTHLFEAYQFNDMIIKLKSIIQPGDLIILKGARAFHFEQLAGLLGLPAAELVTCYCAYRPGAHNVSYNLN